jgi:hypothetical protein
MVCITKNLSYQHWDQQVSANHSTVATIHVVGLSLFVAAAMGSIKSIMQCLVPTDGNVSIIVSANHSTVATISVQNLIH